MEAMEFLVWAVVAMGVLPAVGTVVAALVPSAGRLALGLSGVVLGLGLCVLLLGAVGSLDARRATYRAVASVNPADRDAIIAAGELEAAQPLRAGLLGGVPLVLVAAAVMVLVSARARRAAEVTP